VSLNVLSKETAMAQLAMLEMVAKTRPTARVISELAAVYFTLDNPQAALPLAQAAWRMEKNAGYGMNLALILKDLGRHEESFAVVQQAYFLNPDDPYIQLGYGEALLKAGFWKEAWPIYDNARPTQLGAAWDLGLPDTIKEWDGSPLPTGHKLIVINEGGSGDRISYARWLPELTKLGINWVFYPYGALYSFFERIFPPEKLIKDGTECTPDPTHWCTTFSLPAKLNVSPTKICWTS